MTKQLLVVEDSKHVAQVIAHIGKSLGYEPVIAATLAEVNALLDKPHDFFLATIDYRIPDALDGEAIPLVLKHGIPSIVVTGRMDDKTRKKILNFPVVDYITKENAQAYHYLLRVMKYQQTNRNIGVLVVDDSLTSRNQVLQLLKRRNFKTYGVPDGSKALQALQHYKDIKMVITDHEMPGMDGIELVQRIRKEHGKEELIVIGVSGADRSFQSARFIKNGADDFLNKPFCPEEFYCRIMHNIEKLQHMEEMHKAANTDTLTGLYNRRYFFEQGKKKLKKSLKNDKRYLLVMFDLDKFKAINDTYGHDVGDEVLICFANLMPQYFADDLVARLGGEEFVLLAHCDDIALMQGQIEAFREAVAQTVVTSGSAQLNFTTSIGAAMADGKGDIKEQLSQVDKLLYQAKKNGRNCLVLQA